MSVVFVSYARADETRVAPLVSALEADRLSIWWDQAVGAGEQWRKTIEAQLAAAACVVVVWTRNSIASTWVLEEAARARTRGVLIPVRLDPVDPPFGFAELQVLDLQHWRGSRSDPYYLDLLAAIRAKLEGTTAPPPRGPLARLRRRLAVYSFAGTTGLALSLVGLNVFHVQDPLCAAPVLQPFLSDTCGRLELGGRPTREERLSWEALPPAGCDALREHLERFPHGAYRALAAARLAAARLEQHVTWRPTEQRLRLYVLQDGNLAKEEPAARALALEHGRAQADVLCQGFASTRSFRISAPARVEPREWHCSPTRAGVLCGLEGYALCQLEERVVTQGEVCGASDATL